MDSLNMGGKCVIFSSSDFNFNHMDFVKLLNKAQIILYIDWFSSGLKLNILNHVVLKHCYVNSVILSISSATDTIEKFLMYNAIMITCS